MNLHAKLQQRAAAGKPIRIGLIGAGKFGSMFLAQVPHTPGLEVPMSWSWLAVVKAGVGPTTAMPLPTML